jgi:hypothetical protein
MPAKWPVAAVSLTETAELTPSVVKIAGQKMPAELAA